MRGSLFRQFRGRGGVGELVGIALPLVVSQACETVMLFTDRLFLSRVGPQYMNAAMGGGLTSFLFMTFFIGLTGYANALAAQHLGAGRRRECPLAATQAILVSVIAYPLMVACMPLGHWLFAVLGVPEAQIESQKVYFNVLLLGSLLGLLRHSLASYFSGIGSTRIVMSSAVVSMAVNVLANWILIFGRCGFPAMGIRGAAVGTILGSAAGLAVIAGTYLSRRHRQAWGVWEAMRFDRGMMCRLLHFGYPAGVELFLNMLAFNLMVLAFHSYGLQVATAVTIAFNWDLVSFVPMLGVHVGVISLAGRYMGAGLPQVAHRTTLSGLVVVTLYSGLLVALFGFFPAPLVAVFRPGETAPLAVFMVRLVAVYILADAVGLVFSGALRGAGDTFVTMCLSVLSHGVLSFSTLFMVKVLQVTPRIAWSMVVVLVWGVGLAFYLRYRTGRWRHIRVIPRHTPVTGADSLSAGAR